MMPLTLENLYFNFLGHCDSKEIVERVLATSLSPSYFSVLFDDKSTAVKK